VRGIVKRRERIKEYHQFLATFGLSVDRVRDYRFLIKALGDLTPREKRDVQKVVDALASGQSPNAVETSWDFAKSKISRCLMGDAFALLYMRDLGRDHRRSLNGAVPRR
jgi:hypothetical protein